MNAATEVERYVLESRFSGLTSIVVADLVAEEMGSKQTGSDLLEDFRHDLIRREVPQVYWPAAVLRLGKTPLDPTRGFRQPRVVRDAFEAMIRVEEKKRRGFELVKAMHEQYDFPVGEKPQLLDPILLLSRSGMMGEELVEFVLACADGSLDGAADALVDMVVFALGTAVMMGLPWQELFEDVQRANTSKVREATARSRYDLTKPPGWKGPMTTEILLRAMGMEPKED